MSTETPRWGHLFPFKLLEKFLFGFGKLRLVVCVFQVGVIGARVIGVVDPERTSGGPRRTGRKAIGINLGRVHSEGPAADMIVAFKEGAS